MRVADERLGGQVWSIGLEICQETANVHTSLGIGRRISNHHENYLSVRLSQAIFFDLCSEPDL
jgi:hypothetical protein